MTMNHFKGKQFQQDVILRFPFRSYQLVNLGSQLIAFFATEPKKLNLI